mgnify:CR=1 FL=1
MRILILLILIFSVSANAKEKDVLVIHSYHQGFLWSDDFQDGLEYILTKNKIPNRVVYLDTKRHQSKKYLDQLVQLYTVKLQNEEFKAVIVVDNYALNLINSLGHMLGDTPIIFSGINGYKANLHSNLNATGVVSRVEIQGNVELIKRLQPNVNKIYVITGLSVTGEGVRDTVNQYLDESPSHRELVEHYVPADYESLKAFLAKAPKNSAILYWGFFKDGLNIHNDQEIREKIDEFSSVPVYVFHDSIFGYGTVGGVLHNGNSQGRSAGLLLVDMLANMPGNIPSVRLATPTIELDYDAIQKWGLNISQENTAANLINEPEDDYQWVQVVITIFLLMAAVIMALLYYLRRLSNSESKARESQYLLESVIEQSHQYIAILDKYGRVLTSNNKFHELVFDQGLPIDKPIWLFNGWEDKGAKKLGQFFESNSELNSTRFEIEALCKGSGCILLDVVLNQLPEESGVESQYLFEANDITMGKLAQQKLIERESTMRIYYEQQPVMMLTLDENYRIQALNKFAQELLGYKELEILGHRLKDFYADEGTLPAKQLLLNREHEINGVWRREARYRHKDGSVLWIRENIRPLDHFGKLLMVGEDITEIHILTEQLEYQARYDLLTETFNRNHFELELEKSLKEVSDHLRTHAMLYLDLDQLKVLNDTAGHEAGDAAIKFSAMVVESVLPYNSILSRMGGDEFAVLLRDCTQTDAQNIAKAIINELSINTFQWDDISLNITCSIGIRLIDHTADSPQMVHAQADTACHAAKDEGRNRFHLYLQDDEELRRRQLEMECVNLVHEALANNRLELFAQTILQLEESSDALKMHFEILVRIKSANGEYISPGIFMPASEKYNVAHLIDKAVVTQTLAWLESNIADYDQLGLCSINLSGQSIGNREFVHFLLETIEHSSVPSNKLCLEITETAAMGNMDRAIDLFTQIKQRGCLIALDDFGSGLSSFGYLKKLPVDIVKIDGLFVRDMDTNETDFIMVRAINDLAKQMGKKTVAEFVENTAIIDRLLELGVDYAQGYIVSKPKPLAELVAELQQIQ